MPFNTTLSIGPELPETLQEVEEEIELYEGIRLSLDENTDEGQIAEVELKVARLRSWATWLRAKSRSDLENDSEHPDSRPASSASNMSKQSDGDANYPGVEDNHSLPARTDRKRPSDFLGADLEVPDRKSRRSTPNPTYSAAPSPQSTSDSLDLNEDDPLLRSLLGEDWIQEQRQTKQYLRELEARKRQEDTDRRLAESLQRDMDNSTRFTQLPSSRSLGASRQSQFGSAGGLVKPKRMPPPPPPQARINSESSRSSFGNHTSPMPDRTLPMHSHATSQQYSSRPVKNEPGHSIHDNGFHLTRPAKTVLNPRVTQSGSARPPLLDTAVNSSYSYLLQPQTFIKPESEHQRQSFDQAPQLFRTHSGTSDRGASGSRYSPISIDSESSDGDFQLLPSSDWSSNARISPFTTSADLPDPQGLYVPQSMPGAFPGANRIMSTGGSHVYGGFPYTPSSSYLIPTGIPGTNIVSRHLPGTSHSLTDPDLDRYERTDADITAVLSNIRPDENVRPEDRMQTPLELEIALMPHQELGLAWMVKMEKSTNKGGVLADEMGLGKTIQALSLIVANKPAANDTSRITLIVAPVALMHQWEREIFDRIKKRYRLRVLILHGSRRRMTWRRLQQYDIVITTYGLLASEFKRRTSFELRKRFDSTARPNDKEQCLLLADQMHFHRIILDEAQNIKNRRTRSALGACYLDATYRWCLTGTPMQNSVDEFQSLLRFLRIAPYNSWETFAKDISRPLKSQNDEIRETAMQMLQAIIRSTTLRRTKESKIDGQPILRLPPKTVSESRAEFAKDQEEFYKSLEMRTQLQFNRYVKAGSVNRNYSNILVLLLRLRQACCHPHLVNDFVISTGEANADELLASARELPKQVVQRLKEVEAFECPVCMDAVVNARITNPCGHPLCDECLSRLIESVLGRGDDRRAVPCPSCRTNLDTTKTTDYRSFLKVHCPDSDLAQEIFRDAGSGSNEGSDGSGDDSDSNDGDDGNDDEEGSPESLQDFIVDDDADLGYDSNTSEEDVKPVKAELEAEDEKPVKLESKKKEKKRKGKSRAKDEHAHKSLADLRKEGLRSKSAKKAYLRRLRKEYITSTKVERTIELLEQIHADDSSDKILIFSSFTTFLDLLEVPLSQHGDLRDYARYDGSMTAKDRTAAVEYFSDRPSCKVMLISLKAGNAGLNLTKANHVIVLDPHWNYYVEAQAVDRAHRLGQMKPVQVHRVLINSEDKSKWPEGTVEDRILALQEKKRAVVENALNEEESRSVARLGVRELGYLFGVNRL